jgi:FMN phosphatase YigB (HAD superfamily)
LLIIFDLDDTLIDSSGCLGPAKFKAALKALDNAGLDFGNLPSAHEKLIKLDRTCGSGKETLTKFLQSLPNGEVYLNLALEKYYGVMDNCPPLKLLPGSLEVLNDLHVKHILALVTSGQENEQLRKMQEVAINPGLFKHLIIIDN